MSISSTKAILQEPGPQSHHADAPVSENTARDPGPLTSIYKIEYYHRSLDLVMWYGDHMMSSVQRESETEAAIACLVRHRSQH
jgi:hypothetical protein